MRALALRPGTPARLPLHDLPEPPEQDGPVPPAGRYGEAPPGADQLVLGHEELGRVLEAAPDSARAVGDRLITRGVPLEQYADAFARQGS